MTASDRHLPSGTLTFAPGVTSQTITVAIANDTLFEGALGETFSVALAGASNASMLAAKAASSPSAEGSAMRPPASAPIRVPRFQATKSMQPQA